MPDLSDHIENIHLVPTSTGSATRNHDNTDGATVLTEQDTEEPSRKRLCHVNTDSPAPIVGSNNTIYKFTSSHQTYQALEVSRINPKTIDALSSIVTIIAPCNPSLSPDLLLDLRELKAAHASLAYLKQFPATFTLLMGAMNQPIEKLPVWLWGNPAENALSIAEKQLILTVRFVLTDYANNNNNEQVAPFSDVSERTFLINHVVPIFKTFGNQTKLLSFNWCESQLMQHSRQSRVMVDIGQLNETTLRFVDGLGFDKNNVERLILEVPGGRLSNNRLHASDDTLKIMHSLMCVLKGDAQTHANASLVTYKRVKAFGVQTVQDVVILSEMSLGDNCKYAYKEVMTAAVPVNDSHRSKWLPMFDLLAYLYVQLNEQVNIIRRLQEEHDGVHVVDQNMTLISTLYEQ
ncbi:uncharacterized protein BYT42DRAFT_498822 [Radiomyces spectabilis]|uniref:uncharacterized protein n=1 Tax=Radiomyces spectabilis TaxID=64574 RepID=UPI00222082FF|nr:uncharacterized protein BYT42DRAFT_498822 [Radiomyces spectabilis]KAI8376020.1 hypothetical protein BYT42DRAFT_498822 [Radiomyces spectabilis]